MSDIDDFETAFRRFTEEPAPGDEDLVANLSLISTMLHSIAIGLVCVCVSLVLIALLLGLGLVL